ncbi:MAG: hypothetical protein A2W03_10055 [Candidatus Aminicenantes bacterium RBG_16_63_16]|nr:MAG: hypothetical protein A2W03_10055 [Candidatus Aminicenantes bacterium RBG_16_63_16]
MNFRRITIGTYVRFGRAMACRTRIAGAQLKSLFPVDRIFEGFDLFFMADQTIIDGCTLAGAGGSGREAQQSKEDQANGSEQGLGD